MRNAIWSPKVNELNRRDRYGSPWSEFESTTKERRGGLRCGPFTTLAANRSEGQEEIAPGESLIVKSSTRKPDCAN